MRILVTGGAGFIGHHLVRRLVTDGHDVVVIDDLSTGHASRLDAMREQITFVEGSILDSAALERAVEGCDAILHEAAIPSVARSLVQPIRTNEVNVTGTIRLMLAAADAGIRRVVLAGSSSVYGVPEILPCQETFRPSPRSPYGASKLAAEHYLHTLGDAHGIDTIVLRYFNVFGPGQDPASEYAAVVPRFTTAILAGERPTIYGSGEISRDFTYVDNVVEANVRALDPTVATGLTCNVACGSRHTLSELAETIAAAAGRRIEPLLGPARAGDIRHSHADITLAHELLRYEVVVPFAEGVTRTVAWYREQLSGEESATARPSR